MLLRAQPLLTALVLAGLGLAEPCSEPPSWTIRDLNITTRDEVGENGTAGFQFTYNLTNQTEAITCTLHSNYRCTITGTKNDNSTVIELQIGLGMLYVSVVEDLACGDAGAKRRGEYGVQYGTLWATNLYSNLCDASRGIRDIVKNVQQ
ncbi:hypothetical protein F5Y08DRAFT_353550 [Xylaria arbuscula]|nr:hypothetical protein F5Y08DRAFT_353550 [Xylaria arbuscula]